MKDGDLVRGHVDGEPALLVRIGCEHFLIGAECAHYRGPLEEGVLVGDMIRCPWHHACFSVRDGRALCAPAFDALPAWRLEWSGMRIFARAMLPQPHPARRRVKEGPGSIVVVGAGAAGFAAVHTLREEGYEGALTLIGADPALPYDRPNLSKDYLAGLAPAKWLPLRDAAYYDEKRIELRLGRQATALDAAARRITLDDGTRIDFDAALLTTGAEPIRLPTPGADRPHVHYLRTLADSDALIAAAEQGRRASDHAAFGRNRPNTDNAIDTKSSESALCEKPVPAFSQRALVIGASFIGLEVAAALRARGLAVDVVAPESAPMERLLGRDLGLYVQALHEKHGVVFHLGQTVASIGEKEAVLSKGGVIPLDFVVVGVGVHPNLALAEAAGLALDRGVRVDAYLETSAPGIYAAGDIARWPDPLSGENIRVEHWAVAERQGQTAARNMLGRRERYEAPPFFWSQHYDHTISYVGHAEGWDRLEILGDPAKGDWSASYFKNGRKVAVATVRGDAESLAAELEFERAIEALRAA